MNDSSRAWEQLLSIVMPAYNEEEGIEYTLRGLQARLPRCEIIVVDDASSDRTHEIAEQFEGITLVRHAYNCGYGGALKTGMLTATRPYVAWFDADGEHTVDDLSAMVEKLHAERLCAVIGQRRTPGRSMVRVAGKWVIRLVAKALQFRGGADLNCGLRVFKRDIILRYLHLLPDGFSASVTSFMVILERGYPITTHPVTCGQRLGKSKVSLSDGFTTLVLVLRIIMLFAPLRIFLPLGGLFTVTGTLYSLWLALILKQGLPVAGAVVFLTGVLLISLGLVADQISQLRLAQFIPHDLMVRSRPVLPRNNNDGKPLTRE
jgi:glycosyltransferase involved in cell wall biosynthesis